VIHALDAFNHLGIRFVSVQVNFDDTDSPLEGYVHIIGAMNELESSLISKGVSRDVVGRLVKDMRSEEYPGAYVAARIPKVLQ
jgi:DNA invertase Pin-like site-specific DNA recombinase